MSEPTQCAWVHGLQGRHSQVTTPASRLLPAGPGASVCTSTGLTAPPATQRSPTYLQGCWGNGIKSRMSVPSSVAARLTTRPPAKDGVAANTPTITDGTAAPGGVSPTSAPGPLQTGNTRRRRLPCWCVHSLTPSLSPPQGPHGPGRYNITWVRMYRGCFQGCW